MGIIKAISSPKISVLVPVYKTKEAYLRECIESILGQTFQNFELLLLDDCPEDTNCEEIIQSYQDDRIRYYRNETNLGISASRNKLIELARGEYLAVMDHDDVSMPDRLEKQATFLDTHPNIGVVSSEILRFPQNTISPNPIENHDIKLALMSVCVLCHPAAMIRKSVLTEHHILYEEEFTPAEDYALWCRLIPHTQFHNLPDILLKYRWHETNTSILQNSKMQLATLSIHAFVQQENPALYQEFLLRAKHSSIIRLFGILPLLKIVRQGYKTRMDLFGLLPIITWKTAVKLKEKRHDS